MKEIVNLKASWYKVAQSPFFWAKRSIILHTTCTMSFSCHVSSWLFSVFRNCTVELKHGQIPSTYVPTIHGLCHYPRHRNSWHPMRWASMHPQDRFFFPLGGGSRWIFYNFWCSHDVPYGPQHVLTKFQMVTYYVHKVSNRFPMSSW